MPDWKSSLRTRLQGLRLRPERLAEVVEELSQHLDERYAELLAEGHPAAQAEQLAQAEFADGELPARLRSLRQARAPEPPQPGAPDRSWWLDFGHDLRLALRSLRAAPGFAAVAIVTLALGIGANAAIFALVDATLLRALPLPQPDRVMFLSETTETTPRSVVSPLNLRDWGARNRSFEAVGGYQPFVASMVMTAADGTGENVARQWVTAGVFDALGLEAMVGRTFSAADDRPDNNLVVLSERYWRARFNADPAIVGQILTLDAEPYTVVGVAPQAAELIGASSLWALAPLAGMSEQARGAYFLNVIGRLKADVPVETAQAEMDSIASNLAREYPASNRGRGVRMEAFHDVLVGADLRMTALIFLGAVVLVLLVCCANVANLLLARGSVRAREMAIRGALGATRARMLRQLLTESLLLGVIGAALGLALGSLALSLAPVILPDGLLPGSVVLQFDLRLVGFCLLAALLTALIFGFVPAWQASGLSPARVIGADSRSSVSGGGRLREMLVVGQVATAVALLFAGGLLLRTLLELEAAERGYGADGVLTMLVDPLGSQYPTPTDLLRFYDEVGRQVNALPEVASSAWATTVPLGVSTLGGVFISTTGTMVSDPMQRPVADYQIVSEDYFRTVDVAILAGRAFDQRDAGDSVPVAIVSEAFVRKYLRDDGRADVAALQGVIGRLVGVQTSNAADAPVTQREIIGVARQVKRRPDEPDAAAQLYVPLAQRPIGETFLLVRSRAGDPAALASTVQDTIRGVDTGQLVSLRNVVTLEEVAADATARHRFRAVLIGGFSTLVLVLAATGVFGVLAYAVQQRRRDLGLRMALGAAPRAVVRMVARSALRLLLVGAAIGLLVALVLGQLLGSMLFGVEPFDLTTLLLVGLLLAVSAAIATLVPAWRAAQVDPAVTLRGE